jgi:hypothetical protein
MWGRSFAGKSSIGQFRKAIRVLDEEIEIFGFSNPEIKYLVDKFRKKKRTCEATIYHFWQLKSESVIFT